MSIELRPRVTIKGENCTVVNEGGGVASHSLFRHEPLSTRRKIRLLKLHKAGELWPYGHLSGSNEFSLHEHKLDGMTVEDLNTSDSPFYALSYYWGEPIFDTPLFIDVGGKRTVLPITATAWEAIQRLMPAIDDLGKLMWIDQICINQADEVEKAQQVALMGDIYRRCWHCLIWLGNADDNTEAAFSLLRRLEESLPLNQSVPIGWSEMFDLSHWKIRHLIAERLGRDALPDAEDPGWAAFAKLLKRKWFSRLWTFQEAVLSVDSAATVCCGIHHIPFMTLTRACFFLGNDHSFVGVNFSDSTGAVVQIVIFQDYIEKKKKTPLTWLLQNNTMRECTDPRDRVFALLGLRSEDGPEYEIPVNYQTSPGELFVDVAKKIMRAQASLRICAEAPEREAISGLSNLPSWVPDWTKQPLNTAFEMLLPSIYYFQASKGRVHVDKIGDPNILAVQGKTIDFVVEVLDAEIPDGVTEDNKRMELLENIIPRLHTLLSSRNPDTAVSNLAYTIISTLTLGGYSRRQPIIGDSGLPAAAWSEDICSIMLSAILSGNLPTTELEPQVDFELWMRALIREARWCICRRFAMLEQRPLAVVPRATNVGDLIAILHGSTLPFVLRRAENGCYKLIGACYVDGIMHGEAVDWTEGDIFHIC